MVARREFHRSLHGSSRPKCAIAHKEPGPITPRPQLFKTVSSAGILNERTRRMGPGSRPGRRASVPELLAQNAFLEAVAGVEQHSHRDGLVGQYLDAADVAHFVMVGD